MTEEKDFESRYKILEQKWFTLTRGEKYIWFVRWGFLSVITGGRVLLLSAGGGEGVGLARR